MLHQKVCPLLQDVENVITCQICLLRMEKPKTLTCLHSFCLKCIEGFALKEDGLLYCPVCRKQAKVPREDARQLPTDFLINRILEIQAKHMRMMEINMKVGNYLECTAEQHQVIDASILVDQPDAKNICKCRKYQTALNEARSLDDAVKIAGNHRASDGQNDLSRFSSNTSQGRNEVFLYNIRVEKSQPCKKDKHIFKVEGMDQEYKEGDEIHLKLWKYCYDNGVPCSSWADNAFADLIDFTGRVVRFSEVRISNGGWQFFCKASCTGSFDVIVKVNERPVVSTRLNVQSI